MKSRFLSILVALCCGLPTVGQAATTPARIPVLAGKAKFKDDIVPVYKYGSVKCETLVVPEYPLDMKRDGVEGVGVVMVIIDKKGKVLEVSLMPGTTDLRLGYSLAAAARMWKYYPMLDSAGHPQTYGLLINAPFVLR